ncbi:MAG: hypothetical protein P4N60_19300 [Verrucomicrobiae bacterium]|nr:hypothetical protein [Verrucomicrobiae bacterium]
MTLHPIVVSQVIADVRTYLQKRQPVTRFELEKPLFDKLPSTIRNEVRRLQAACNYVRNLTTGKGRIKVQPACEKALAIYTELRPLKTFNAKYAAWAKQQDWFCLVNRAKAGAVWQKTQRGLTDAFLDYVAARAGQFKRGDTLEQAIISIHRQWQTGRTHKGIAEVIPGYEKDWDTRQRAVPPDGWHSTNIRKQLTKRAKFTRAVKAAMHEGIAAARAYLPQVHSTRAGDGQSGPLRFMELIQFDDVRCDFRVIDTVTGQICDLWLLVARDVATTMLLNFGMRPALARDDGSQEHLKLQDMKELIGWNLEAYGLPPWKMFLKLENGTATLASAVRAALVEMLGEDRIDFSLGSMIGGLSPTGYKEKALGNSKAKAMLESLNRLQHMMTSHFPGQIGAHYGKRPAELTAREQEAQEIWRSHRAEDRADLIYPVLTIPQAREKLLEVFRLQNARSAHQCEGFEQVVEWHDLANDCWRTGTPLVADCKVRVRMESPVERAGRLLIGCQPFTPVSPEIFTSFYEHTQRTVTVTNSGEVVMMHEGKTFRFQPPSAEFALVADRKVLCYFNPNDPRFVTLTDGRGGILGTWLRTGLVKHGDREALSAAIRHSVSALNVVKERASELAAGERAELDTMRQHNAGFVTVFEPAGKMPALPVTSVVARHQVAVAGEKQITKQKQRRREDDERIAREALGA